MRKAAKLQEEHTFDHPLGMKVAKYVTVVVSPNATGDVAVEAYMISDMGQTLERDNCFGESENRKMLVARKAGDSDMVPPFIREGKTVTELEPEFFIVSLAHG